MCRACVQPHSALPSPLRSLYSTAQGSGGGEEEKGGGGSGGVAGLWRRGGRGGGRRVEERAPCQKDRGGRKRNSSGSKKGGKGRGKGSAAKCSRDRQERRRRRMRRKNADKCPLLPPPFLKHNNRLSQQTCPYTFRRPKGGPASGRFLPLIIFYARHSGQQPPLPRAAVVIRAGESPEAEWDSMGQEWKEEEEEEGDVVESGLFRALQARERRERVFFLYA